MRQRIHGRIVASQLKSVSYVLALAVALTMLANTPVCAQPACKLGALVYTPAYSQVYQGPRNHPFLLTVVLTIRNVDPKRAITLESVQYYNAEGQLLNEYELDSPVLPPLAAKKFIVDEKDARGGSGAGFLVRWKAEEPANAPLIETVMVSTTGGQGISFVCRGVEVTE